MANTSAPARNKYSLVYMYRLLLCHKQSLRYNEQRYYLTVLLLSQALAQAQQVSNHLFIYLTIAPKSTNRADQQLRTDSQRATRASSQISKLRTTKQKYDDLVEVEAVLRVEKAKRKKKPIQAKGQKKQRLSIVDDIDEESKRNTAGSTDTLFVTGNEEECNASVSASVNSSASASVDNSVGASASVDSSVGTSVGASTDKIDGGYVLSSMGTENNKDNKLLDILVSTSSQRRRKQEEGEEQRAEAGSSIGTDYIVDKDEAV